MNQQIRFEGFNFDDCGHDLEVVVDACGLERFALAGMSQGGPIAMRWQGISSTLRRTT